MRPALTASAWNGMLDVSQAFKEGKLGGTGQDNFNGRHSGLDVIRVKNTTSDDVPLGGVLGIGTFLFLPSDGLPQFKAQDVLLTGVDPVEADHFGSFVVALETIAAGRLGWCAISGVCKVQLDVDDTTDMFAHPITSDVDKLQAGPVGTCRILAKESGTGTKWGIVSLGDGQVRGRFTLNETLSAGSDAGADLTRPDGSGGWEDSSRDYDLYDQISAFDGVTDDIVLAEWDFTQKRWAVYQKGCSA